MRKKFLSVSLLLGITFDLLFWKKAPGISFALFTLACLLSGILLLRSENIRPAKMSIPLFALILFFAVMTFMRKEPFTSCLNFALTLGCMAMLAMTYRSGRWMSFNFKDFMVNTFHLAGSMFTLAWSQTASTSSSKKGAIQKYKPGQVWPILRGCLLALPVLLIFGALLSSADLIFAQKVNEVFNHLNLQKLSEYLFRGAIIGMLTYFLAGIFRHAAERSQAERRTQKEKPLLAPCLGFTEAAILSGSVLLLFTAFVLLQFQYLFSGTANISLTGFTYAEYARRGFGELMAVAVFSLLLLQILSYVTKRTTIRQQVAFHGLSIGLVSMLIIILVSSFQRLSLYEAAYGFSRLRSYAHVFIIWLGLLLAAEVILEIIQHQGVFLAVALLVLAGFAASLNILNVDAFIAHQNIQRAEKGQALDVTYLASLTGDAVPALVRDFSSSNPDPKVKDGIGAVLACLKFVNDAKTEEMQPWQSFNYADWNAGREINKVQERLKSYQVQGETRPFQVLNSAGSAYSCQNSH
jgi:hypothetical protein